MEEGEARVSADTAPTEQGTGPFRPGPERTPFDPEAGCRFLARVGENGVLLPALPVVDPAHRCTAIGDPVPQSNGQQELTCLTGAHVNCPRYLRGLLIAGTPAPPPRREPVSRAVIGASLVLVASLAASFGFLAVRGGISMPVPNPSTGLVAAVATPTAAASIAAPPSPTATPLATPSPSSTPSSSPVPTPTPSSEPTPTPTEPPATPTPKPSSDRYALLTKCPSTPDCWIYTIRSGDNLVSIANWFGVDYDRMIAMNPGLRIPIHAGDELRIPTPTR